MKYRYFKQVIDVRRLRWSGKARVVEENEKITVLSTMEGNSVYIGICRLIQWTIRRRVRQRTYAENGPVDRVATGWYTLEFYGTRTVRVGIHISGSRERVSFSGWMRLSRWFRSFFPPLSIPSPSPAMKSKWYSKSYESATVLCFNDVSKGPYASFRYLDLREKCLSPKRLTKLRAVYFVRYRVRLFFKHGHLYFYKVIFYFSIGILQRFVTSNI